MNRNRDFSHVRTWVFDLDNTLYPPQIRLFDQIEAKMREFVSDFLNVTHDVADRLRAEYWKNHGTTLAGLMDQHAMPPHDFLDYVHDIDFSELPHAPALAQQIDALPGRKIVYTNGTRDYAGKVLKARGLDHVFESVYGVEHAGFRPKPERQAFDRVFEKAGVKTANAAMFEDEVRNLKVPFDMGMRTVHIAPSATGDDFVDHHHHDLSDQLSQILDTPFETKS